MNKHSGNNNPYKFSFFLQYWKLALDFPTTSLIPGSDKCAQEFHELGQALQHISSKFGLEINEGSSKISEIGRTESFLGSSMLSSSNQLSKDSVECSLEATDKSSDQIDKVDRTNSLTVSERENTSNSLTENDQNGKNSQSESKIKIKEKSSTKSTKSNRPKLSTRTTLKPVQPRIKSHSCIDPELKKAVPVETHTYLRKQKGAIQKKDNSKNQSNLQSKKTLLSKSQEELLPSPTFSQNSLNTVGSLEKVSYFHPCL